MRRNRRSPERLVAVGRSAIGWPYVRLLRRTAATLRRLGSVPERPRSTYRQLAADALRRITPVLERGWALGVTEIQAAVNEYRDRVGMADRDDIAIPDHYWQWYRSMLDATLDAYGDRVERWIERTTIEAANEGWTAEHHASVLRSRVEGMTMRQAETVARTEINRLFNHGAYAEMAFEPSIVAYAYFTIVDDRTSEYCRPLDGRIVPKHPPPVVPPLHPNCRTALLPVFEGEYDQPGAAGSRPITAPGYGAPPPVRREAVT